MTGSIVKGSIIGAIIAFVWGFASWMVLPWHETLFSSFQNQEFISWVLKENAPKKGIYLSPYIDHKMEGSEQEKQKAWEQYKTAREKGPIVFAAISPKGEKFGMQRNLILNFAMYLVGCGIVSALLRHTNCQAYKSRVGFVTGIGVLIALIGIVPLWNWWSFPNNYVAVEMADTIITWFLVGLGLAWVVKPGRASLAG